MTGWRSGLPEASEPITRDPSSFQCNCKTTASRDHCESVDTRRTNFRPKWGIPWQLDPLSVMSGSADSDDSGPPPLADSSDSDDGNPPPPRVHNSAPSSSGYLLMSVVEPDAVAQPPGA